MLKEIKAKTILHYHERTFATNWDANIYRGCEHRCVYCFAQYSHRYLDDKSFFGDIYVKSNASEVLESEFSKKKWKKVAVNLSGVSDCYQPAEKEYNILPKVIESFIKHNVPLVIVTKSTLPLRDFELIKKLNEVIQVTIVVSVSTLDEKKRVLIEPNTAPTIERLKMLKKFKDIGCNTAILFMPIIPFITDDNDNLERIFKITSDNNLGSIEAWPLHLHGITKSKFLNFLAVHFPKLVPLYHNLYPGGSVSHKYKTELESKIAKLREKYNLYERYSPVTIEPEDEWVQQTLF